MLIINAKVKMIPVKNPYKSSNGFTLLELLVSIMILSLIVTISYSALRIGGKSWDKAIQIINENSDFRAAVQVLRKKLEHTYPIYWKQENNQTLSFIGDEDGMKFIAPSPEGREVGEYYEYFISASRGATNTSLILYYMPHNPENTSFEIDKDSSNTTILSELSTVSFSYYGRLENNEQETWYDEWIDTATSFPSRIQIKITGNDTTNLTLDLIIRLHSKIYIS